MAPFTAIVPPRDVGSVTVRLAMLLALLASAMLTASVPGTVVVSMVTLVSLKNAVFSKATPPLVPVTSRAGVPVSPGMYPNPFATLTLSPAFRKVIEAFAKPEFMSTGVRFENAMFPDELVMVPLPGVVCLTGYRLLRSGCRFP